MQASVSKLATLGKFRTYHGVDKLNAVVVRRVVASCDQDSDDLAIELPRPQGCEQANTVDDGIKQRTVANGSFQPCPCLPEDREYWGILMRLLTLSCETGRGTDKRSVSTVRAL